MANKKSLYIILLFYYFIILLFYYFIWRVDVVIARFILLFHMCFFIICPNVGAGPDGEVSRVVTSAALAMIYSSYHEGISGGIGSEIKNEKVSLSEQEVIKKLKRYCVIHEKKNQYLKRKLESADEYSNKVGSQVTSLQDCLAVRNQEYEELNDKYEELNDKYKELKNSIVCVSRDNEELNAEKKDLTGKNKILFGNNTFICKKNKYKKKRISELEGSLERLKEKYAPSVYIKTSDKPGAGLGLFAGCDIEQTAKLGDYTGKRVCRVKIPSTGKYVVWEDEVGAHLKFLKTDSYTLWATLEHDGYQIEKGIDGSFPDSSGKITMLSRINHSYKHNVVALITGKVEDRISIYCHRPIKKDQEIFWDYNDGSLRTYSGGEFPPQDSIHGDPERYVEFNPQTKQVEVKKEYRTPNADVKKTIWRCNP